MGTFDRLSNVMKGALSNAVGDLERANPAAVYEAAIDNALAQVERHKQAAAGLVAQRTRLAEAIEGLERDLVRARQSLSGALQEGDDDTALVMVSHKEGLEATLEDKRREHAEVAAQVEQTTEGLRTLREDVEALKREQHTALAKLQVAQASIDIDEANSGFSDAASAKGLDSVRSSIHVLDAQANEGYLDAEGNSVRGQAQAMGRKAAEADARAQLEQMKRARGLGAKPEAAPDADDIDEAEDSGPTLPKRRL